MENEKGHDLPTVDWRIKKSDVLIQSEPKRLWIEALVAQDPDWVPTVSKDRRRWASQLSGLSLAKANWHKIIIFYIYVSEKAMAPHSSTLAWKIPWMEEPGRPQSMGSLRVRHNWATALSLFTFMHWRRKWQPTRVLAWRIPGTGEPVGLPSLGSHRVRHDWSDIFQILWNLYYLFSKTILQNASEYLQCQNFFL